MIIAYFQIYFQILEAINVVRDEFRYTALSKLAERSEPCASTYMTRLELNKIGHRR